MTSPFTSRQAITTYPLWKRMMEKRVPMTMDLEVTARCNNNCRHCYINLPAGDRKAARDEMTLGEIVGIARQARDLGVVWCLLTGGEPLLRDDFSEIYREIRKMGILTSVFTNACLLTEDHMELFSRYPPRDIEVTVYGATKETYERVTRRKGSFMAFRRGLDLLIRNGVRVRLKAMVLRSNIHELDEISTFCRRYTKDFYRFDPVLHKRYDRDPVRNREIEEERLTPGEVVSVEHADPDRSSALIRNCNELIRPAPDDSGNHLFRCGAGRSSFTVGYNGMLRLCSSLCHPSCMYDLRKGDLSEAWNTFIPRVREMRSDAPVFLQKCHTCGIVNLCLWCPAHAYLEDGELDAWSGFFCEVAHARADAIRAAGPDAGKE